MRSDRTVTQIGLKSRHGATAVTAIGSHSDSNWSENKTQSNCRKYNQVAQWLRLVWKWNMEQSPLMQLDRTVSQIELKTGHGTIAAFCGRCLSSPPLPNHNTSTCIHAMYLTLHCSLPFCLVCPQGPLAQPLHSTKNGWTIWLKNSGIWNE